MPGKPAAGRRKLTVWVDGDLLDRYRSVAAPRSLARLIQRSIEAELASLEAQSGANAADHIPTGRR